MANFILSRGEIVQVDDNDLPLLGNFKWHKNKGGYAVRYRNHNKIVYMHRLLTDCPKLKVVDHINGDKLDNRRSNLRVCTTRENIRNRQTVKSKSGHLGVYWAPDTKNWYAQIGLDGKSTGLGHYTDIEDAILARKDAEIKYYGEFAPSWVA